MLCNGGSDDVAFTVSPEVGIDGWTVEIDSTDPDRTGPVGPGAVEVSAFTTTLLLRPTRAP